MSGKSRKGAASSRSASGNASPQTNNPSQGAASVSQATPASPTTTRRPSPLVWVALVIVAVLAIYAALVFFAPSVLPNWIRFPLLCRSNPSAGRRGWVRISFVRATDNGTKRDLFVMNSDGTTSSRSPMTSTLRARPMVSRRKTNNLPGRYQRHLHRRPPHHRARQQAHRRGPAYRRHEGR